MHALLIGLLSIFSAGADRGALEEACQDCHRQEAAEWRQSFHRRAYTNEAYARSLAREPRAFCRGCHAPEANARLPATGWQAENGVACVSCHLRNGQIISGASRNPTNTKLQPHPVVRDAKFATKVCRPCHEFGFPDGRMRVRRELMQSTISEHAASAEARSCIDCHMPVVENRRSHLFPGGHDAAFVKGALSTTARRDGGVIELSLAPREVGHALPTGDLFRRLAIIAEATDHAGKSIRVARYLQRRFGMEQQLPGSFVRVETSDDRLRRPTVVRLQLPQEQPAAGPVRWQVRYQRVAHPGLNDDAAELDGEIVLAQGLLP